MNRICELKNLLNNYEFYKLFLNGMTKTETNVNVCLEAEGLRNRYKNPT